MKNGLFHILVILAVLGCKSRSGQKKSEVASENLSNDPFKTMLENIGKNISAIEMDLLPEECSAGNDSESLSLANGAVDCRVPEIEMQGDVIIRRGELGLGTFSKGTATWPKGIVPYKISYTPKDAGDRVLDDIVSAMNHIQKNTNVQFVNAANPKLMTLLREQNIVNFSGELEFINSKSTVCAADKGYSTSPKVVLSTYCSQGIIVHELLHSLGFDHEHMNPLRDRYVQILQQNMVDTFVHTDGKSYSPQFAYEIIKDQDPVFGNKPYDYSSILHYGSFYFSKNNYATMLTIDGRTIIPNRVSLSQGDIDAINTVYPVKTPLPAMTSTTQSSTQKSVQPQKCVCSIDTSGTICAVFKSLGNEKWQVLASTPVTLNDKTSCNSFCNPNGGVLSSYMLRDECR